MDKSCRLSVAVLYGWTEHLVTSPWHRQAFSSFPVPSISAYLFCWVDDTKHIGWVKMQHIKGCRQVNNTKYFAENVVKRIQAPRLKAYRGPGSNSPDILEIAASLALSMELHVVSALYPRKSPWCTMSKGIVVKVRKKFSPLSGSNLDYSVT
jgi:hypothetical protein